MSTYIKLNNAVQGPLTEVEIRQKLAAGDITTQTPAWRMGMAEWTTIAALLPPATPAATPPPLPTSPLDDESFAATLAAVNEAVDRLSRPFQPDALERLAAMERSLLAPLERRLGLTARPNHTFFSHRLATTAIQRLRLDLLKGAALTARGEEYVAQIAAYLAMVALHNWRRRGLSIQGRIHFQPGASDNEIYFEASRERNGQREVCVHDFLRDTHALLLRPPDWFPYLKDQVYAIQSLTLPSPEQLYLYGVCFLQSPSAYKSCVNVGKLRTFSAARSAGTATKISAAPMSIPAESGRITGITALLALVSFFALRFLAIAASFRRQTAARVAQKRALS